MNVFLRKQLAKKIDKFFEGKSDLFVLGCTQWLCYGGLLEGKPKNVDDAGWEELQKNIMGESLLANFLSDYKNETKYFTALSGTDKEYIEEVSRNFFSECYHRLKIATVAAKNAEEKSFVAKLGTKDRGVLKQMLAEDYHILSEQLEDLENGITHGMDEEEAQDLISEKKKRLQVLDKAGIQSFR
jgi:hypothetical protein